MKTKLRTVRIMIITLLMIIISQASVFAAVHNNVQATGGLSGAKIVGAVFIVLLAIVLPLTRAVRK